MQHMWPAAVPWLNFRRKRSPCTHSSAFCTSHCTHSIVALDDHVCQFRRHWKNVGQSTREKGAAKLGGKRGEGFVTKMAELQEVAAKEAENKAQAVESGLQSILTGVTSCTTLIVHTRDLVEDAYTYLH